LFYNLLKKIASLFFKSKLGISGLIDYAFVVAWRGAIFRQEVWKEFKSVKPTSNGKVAEVTQEA
jgi:hypothetical protein